MNPSNSEFINRENVEMLWEIIIDEDSLKGNNMEQLNNYFQNEVRVFYEGAENIDGEPGDGLFQMNKNFITTFMETISIRTHQQQKQSNKHPYNLNTPAEFVTVEEIHADRKNQFEKDLSNKQNEFQRAIALQVPESPNFSDRLDRPIKEMDELIARTLAERNFEIEHIRSVASTTNKGDNMNWLNPVETSIQNEKHGYRAKSPESSNPRRRTVPGSLHTSRNSSEPLKLIRIGEETLNSNIVAEELTERKSVSWAKNIQKLETDSGDGGRRAESMGSMPNDSENPPIRQGRDNKQDIFSKLKYNMHNSSVYSQNKITKISDDPFTVPVVSDTQLLIDVFQAKQDEIANLHKKLDDIKDSLDIPLRFINAYLRELEMKEQSYNTNKCTTVSTESSGIAEGKVEVVISKNEAIDS